MYGSMGVTAEALKAAAAWVTAGPDMGMVSLDVRVGVLFVDQGDDGAEFHEDGRSDDVDDDPGHADGMVEAVLNVLAPYVDGPPGFQPQRWPAIRFDYEGQMVLPNDDQLRELAQSIVTAIRTASQP